jgi:hypothetical protein
MEYVKYTTPKREELRGLIHEYYKGTLELAKLYENNKIVHDIEIEINKLPNFDLERLTLEYPISEIKKIYNKYKIIVLKYPFIEHMFIGKNANVGFMNIDISLDSNPNIIACFGLNVGIIDFYKDVEFMFKSIYSVGYNFGVYMTDISKLPFLNKTFYEIFSGGFGTFIVMGDKIQFYGNDYNGLLRSKMIMS